MQHRRFIGAPVERVRHFSDLFLHLVALHGRKTKPSLGHAIVRERKTRGEDLKRQIARVHAANYGVYGARKVWLALNRESIPVATRTVERLMAELGLFGPSAVRHARRRSLIRAQPPPVGSRRAPVWTAGTESAVLSSQVRHVHADSIRSNNLRAGPSGI